jgi:hypothetical protein
MPYENESFYKEMKHLEFVINTIILIAWFFILLYSERGERASISLRWLGITWGLKYNWLFSSDTFIFKNVIWI